MQGQVQPLIGIMIVLIIGVAVTVPVITNTVNDATQAFDIENEFVAGVNGTTDTVTYSRLCSSLLVYNQSGGTEIITDGNYTFTSATCDITWDALNNTLYPAGFYVNYTGHTTSYQTSGTSRTLLNVLPLLVVVALVLIVVGWMKIK